MATKGKPDPPEPKPQMADRMKWKLAGSLRPLRGRWKKLIVVLVKGLDDSCPNCAAAVENGERAIGSGVVKIFARAESLSKEDLSAYPAAFQERAKKKFTTTAAVTFLVFDPAMEKLIAEATRDELQRNKKLTAEFKKTVKEAKDEHK